MSPPCCCNKERRVLLENVTQSIIFAHDKYTHNTMNKFFTLVCSLMLWCVVTAFAKDSFDVQIWPKGAPVSNGASDSVYAVGDTVAGPFMRVFLAPKAQATGRVVVALPGGGYGHLSSVNEGYAWAPFFNERGISLFVLNYRMPRGHSDVPASDVYEAIRIIRQNAEKWNINPQDLGIMGSSAGGHLATTVATHATPDVRPNFQILFYPVVTMDSTYTHRGSRSNLLGRKATPGLEHKYSNELQVDNTVPPAILLCSDDDRAVPTPNSVQYYLALRANGVRASLYIYPSGGHGWGFKSEFKYHDTMLQNLSDWLDQLKSNQSGK
jgi:acetyl esterase/lipase